MTVAAAAAFNDVFHLMVAIAVLSTVLGLVVRRVTAVPQGEAASAVEPRRGPVRAS